NDRFVCIKIDREERPDLDAIYMQACQIFNGSGGWPLNCFLTPEGKPFFAGTYYPPRPAYQRPSWQQVLISLSEAYQQKRGLVMEQSEKFIQLIQQSENNFIDSTNNAALPISIIDDIFSELKARYDDENGGFGSAPKFPSTMALQYFCRYYFYKNSSEALHFATHTLTQIIRGGIYDQLGGGFARYTVDAAWFIPHFEKMLYDNALIINILCDVYKITKNEIYSNAIRETLDFVAREMTDSTGLFYSAIDADSEGIEGKFYTWQQEEINEILGDDAAFFCSQMGVVPDGNWEHTNILFRTDAYVESERLQQCKQLLFQKREKRVRPILDDKSLLDWNALMVTAFAKAFQTIGDEAYKHIAVNGIEQMLLHFRKGEILYHTYKNGIAKQPAFLDDYANLIESILCVYQITENHQLLKQAQALTQQAITLFYDESDGLFFFASKNQTDNIIRRKEVTDNATPSGNATMCKNLRCLGCYLHIPDYTAMADKMLTATQHAMMKYPTAFGKWACNVWAYFYSINEVSVVGLNAFEKLIALQQAYLPDTIFSTTTTTVEDAAFPLLLDKYADPDAAIYICRQFACQAPTENVAEALAILQSTNSKL
ncbi:MAG: thioredoxin domain-containing protein, partial [Saprospiraceae bacterium]